MQAAYVQSLFDDSPVVALRHQMPGGWHTSWHEDETSLLEEAESRADSGNLFCSLNAIDSVHIPPPEFSQLPPDQKQPRAGVFDSMIKRHSRLFFDFDSIKPQKGIPASDTELQAAIDRAQRFRQCTSAWGWSEPAFGISGNGAHLHYRVAMPNNDDTIYSLINLYRGLQNEFSDDKVRLDSTTRNPARVAPLYGTIKRKGSPSPDRPHRLTSVEIPYNWEQTTKASILKIAQKFEPIKIPKPAAFSGAVRPGRADYGTLDLARAFAEKGQYIRHIRNNVHAVLCPWIDEHTMVSRRGGDTVVFENPFPHWDVFHCSHDHCDGRGVKDLNQIWGNLDRYCRS